MDAPGFILLDGCFINVNTISYVEIHHTDYADKNKPSYYAELYFGNIHLNKRYLFKSFTKEECLRRVSDFLEQAHVPLYVYHDENEEPEPVEKAAGRFAGVDV